MSTTLHEMLDAQETVRRQQRDENPTWLLVAAPGPGWAGTVTDVSAAVNAVIRAVDAYDAALDRWREQVAADRTFMLRDAPACVEEEALERFTASYDRASCEEDGYEAARALVNTIRSLR